MTECIGEARAAWRPSVTEFSARCALERAVRGSSCERSSRLSSPGRFRRCGEDCFGRPPDDGGLDCSLSRKSVAARPDAGVLDGSDDELLDAISRASSPSRALVGIACSSDARAVSLSTSDTSDTTADTSVSGADTSVDGMSGIGNGSSVGRLGRACVADMRVAMRKDICEDMRTAEQPTVQ